MQEKSFLGCLAGVFLVSILVTVAVEAEEANLLRNPSFEEGLKEWTVPPPEWIIGKGVRTPAIDDAIIQGAGHSSLKMIGEEGKGGRVFQNIPPVAGRYRLSGWMKIRDFPVKAPWAARIYVVCTDENHKWLGMFTASTAHGVSDIDWKRYEVEFEMPEKTAVFRVVLDTANVKDNSCDGVNTGTAWFDNLSLNREIMENK
ncbi:MAG: hypothetical protein WAX69_02595 [Victivallales bacterium]